MLVLGLLYFFFFVFRERGVWVAAGGAVGDDPPLSPPGLLDEVFTAAGGAVADDTLPPPSPRGLLDGSDAAAAVGLVDNDEEEARRSLHSFLWPACHASIWQASLQ